MKRLDCLDGLRGVLAVYVMLGHMAPFADLPAWVERPLSHGGAAVDVFFMLSGLVIVRSLDTHAYAARPFLIARVARIFPVYLVMLAAAVAVQPLAMPFDAMPWIPPTGAARDIQSTGWPPLWAGDLAAHLTMTHGLFPNGLRPNAWNAFLGAAWSLSTEWQFYLLALCLGRRGLARLVVLFLILAVMGLAWNRLTPEAWQFSRAFLPNKAHHFALGVMSAVWLEKRCDLRLALVLAGTLGVCLADGRLEKALPPLVWMACLMAQVWPGRLAALLRGQWLQRLGAVSYPLYLANEPIQKLLCTPLAWLAGGDGPLFTVLWVPAATLLPVAAAWWLHRRVEIPGMRWSRQVIAPRAATGHTHSTRPPRTPTYQS